MEKGAVMLSRYSITLATLGPGSFFGEGALTKQRYSDTSDRTSVSLVSAELSMEYRVY